MKTQGQKFKKKSKEPIKEKKIKRKKEDFYHPAMNDENVVMLWKK